jgi:hypothetical protein
MRYCFCPIVVLNVVLNFAMKVMYSAMVYMFNAIKVIDNAMINITCTSCWDCVPPVGSHHGPIVFSAAPLSRVTSQYWAIPQQWRCCQTAFGYASHPIPSPRARWWDINHYVCMCVCVYVCIVSSTRKYIWIVSVGCEGTKGLEESSSVASSRNADRGIHICWDVWISPIWPLTVIHTYTHILIHWLVRYMCDQTYLTMNPKPCAIRPLVLTLYIHTHTYMHTYYIIHSNCNSH